MFRREIVTPPGWRIHGPGMVPGTIANGFIFFSALRGQNPITTDYSDDANEQAEQILSNLRGLLEANGAKLDHVVSVTLYLGKLKDRAPFHAAWMRYFPSSPPARIAVEVADANALPDRNAYFAISVVAVTPTD